MRSGIIIAAALTIVSATGLSATSAQADEWCGYAAHDNAMIECGYTTAADCESAMGKGGMCFLDPDVGLKPRRFTPGLAARLSPRHG
jgi:Protein of unknown function (DUF3551)